MSPAPCLSGGTHSLFGDYAVVADHPTAAGEHHWRRCTNANCRALFFGDKQRISRCIAGGTLLLGGGGSGFAPVPKAIGKSGVGIFNRKLPLLVAVLALLLALGARLSASPLGTAFTFQGRLNEDGCAANGIYDFRFAVHDHATNGSLVSGVLTNDVDLDGLPNVLDNCPNVSNPSQQDRDGDGVGDACVDS